MRTTNAAGGVARVSETSVRGIYRGSSQTGIERLWIELAVRSLGLHADRTERLRDVHPSWGRIALLLFESGQLF